MALVERQLEEIKFEKPGMTVCGYLIEIEKTRFKDGSTGTKFLLMARNRNVIVVPGSTQLNRKLTMADTGRFVHVRFDGEESGEVAIGMSRKKLFTVAVDDTDVFRLENCHPDAITDDDIGF